MIAFHVLLAVLILSNVAKSEDANSIKFEFLSEHYVLDISRAGDLGRAINFQIWPTTNILRVVPVSSIDKFLLQHPEFVTRESKSYDIVQFGQEDYWGCFQWSVGCIEERSDQDLPTQLASEHKEIFMSMLPPESQNDPNFIENYLQDILQRYRKSFKYNLEGEMFVKICLTPNSKAAHEYLLSQMIENALPTESLVRSYVSSEKSSELGTISFIVDLGDDAGLINFIRDNIVVIVDAHGIFSGEILQLAKKIDSVIMQQPALTYQQLVSHRPIIELAADIDKEKTGGRKTISYNTTTSNKEDIVCLRASTVEGQYNGVKGGEITLPNKDKPITVKLIAITKGLLVSTIEKEIDIHN